MNKASRNRPETEEQQSVKEYKKRKKHHEVDEKLDEDELSPDVFDFCQRHMKHKG